uniref:Uncharacterized protein n=1 Tax=Anguilla anguilla TaxID=7936 RepID=A0A0E9QGP0_ANGAN
MLLITYTL